MIDFLFIFIAKYLIIIPPVIAGLYFIYQPLHKKKSILIFSGTTILITGLFALIGGIIYYNPRPFIVEHFIPLISHSSNNGFPSDHVLLASTIATLFSFYNRKVALFLWLTTALIAYSRVFVGVHHLIDVVGSMVISILSGVIASNLTKRHQKTIHSHPTHSL